MADQTNGIGTQTAIDDLETKQNDFLTQQQTLNDQIVDKGIQKTQLEVDLEKQQYEQEATKEAQALSGNYQKEASQYGTQNESLASQGLQNSGYAESSRVNLYNNYQSNVTSIMNNLNQEKAKLDLQMNQAYLDGDIQKAQNAVSILQQQMELAMNTYELRYTLYRDQVADEQWEKNYQLQLAQLANDSALSAAQANYYNSEANYNNRRSS